MAQDVASIAAEIGIIEGESDFTTIVKEVGFLANNAIPIPLSYGDLVRERFDDTVQFYAPYHRDWKETIRQYSETGAYSDNAPNEAPKENFIRQNVSALVEQTYMRNPVPEYTFTDGEEDEVDRKFINTLSAAVTRLGELRHTPGLNLKTTAQAQIIRGHLTNWGVIKICYTPYNSSQEAKMKVYAEAEKLLRKAKELSEVRDKYDALQRLYTEAMSSTPFGLSLKVVSPFAFMVDTRGIREDLNDARFTFEIEPFAIEAVQYSYCQKDDEDQWVYRYDTTRVFKAEEKYSTATEELKDKIIREVMPEANAEENKVLEKNTVPCVWVFDRVLRKSILYVMGQWDTPLWVFEDELQLSRFFPYFLLTFTPSVAGLPRLGEPAYYLAHQKEVNADTALFTQVKRAASTLLVYDTEAIDKIEVDKVMEEALRPSSRMRAIGVKLRNKEQKLDDVWGPFKFPITQLAQLFDTTLMKNTIASIARVSPAAKGEQFKTNTTNMAVQSYQQADTIRIGAMIDNIEEMMSQLFHSINEVVVSKYDKSMIAEIVGEKAAEFFTTMSVKDFNKKYQIQIEGGSIEKPTSENKKREAFALIQLLGQFGKAAPMTVLSLVTKLIRNSVSKFLVSDTDLETLKQEGTAAMSKGVSTPQENANV